MRRLVAAATLSVALVSACSDSTGPSTIFGTYTLATINGSALPQVVDSDPTTGATLEVTAGTVIVSQDGTFSDRTDFRLTESGQVTTGSETATGAWNRSGDVITFTPNDGTTPYSMTIGNRTLTQDFVDQSAQHFILVYRR
jgi:hypothetical protein